uniref:Uncharacterized protein n=1 Tax=Anguilla anguilla TaxID=7936 RepID=A0A0E9SE52_ANGAN
MSKNNSRCQPNTAPKATVVYRSLDRVTPPLVNIPLTNRTVHTMLLAM